MGTLKHSHSEELLNRYKRMFGNRALETESSWLNGTRVNYGTKGSTRLDVIDWVTGKIYDYKFTTNPGKGLSQRQINKILNNGPSSITNILEVNP